MDKLTIARTQLLKNPKVVPMAYRRAPLVRLGVRAGTFVLCQLQRGGPEVPISLKSAHSSWWPDILP